MHRECYVTSGLSCGEAGGGNITIKMIQITAVNDKQWRQTWTLYVLIVLTKTTEKREEGYWRVQFIPVLRFCFYLFDKLKNV